MHLSSFEKCIWMCFGRPIASSFASTQHQICSKKRKDSYPNALIQPSKMHLGMCLSAAALSGKCMFPALKKRIWLVTDAYAIVVSLQAPIYFRFLALVSWSWVVMNHKRVYSQENARMHFARPE